MRLRRTWVLLVGLLLIAGLSSCGQQAGKEVDTKAIAAIRGLGGDVGFDENNSVVKVRFKGPGSKVTDDGLVHLKGLTNLQFLSLSRTKVTDAGLVHLKGLTKLQYLHLSDTKVTDEGVKKLKQTLPNCEISH